MYQLQQSDLKVQPRLQRSLQVFENIQRDLQVPRQVVFRKRRRDPREPILFRWSGRDQPSIRSGNLDHQQVPEIPRQLAAKMLQVAAVPF